MSDGVDRSVLPIRRPPFAGVAGKTLGDSQPDWGLIGHVKPPAGAPNVLLVLIDDAGFGNPGTFLLRRDQRRHQRADHRTEAARR
jgi:hypothetical protein